MANHASAEKRNRQRVKRTLRNKAIRSALRTQLKVARKALTEGDQGAAESLVKKASVALARAVTKGVLHRNTASRTTSRINKQLSALKG